MKRAAHHFLPRWSTLSTATAMVLVAGSAQANDQVTLAAMQAQLQALSAHVSMLNAKVVAQDKLIAAQAQKLEAQTAVAPATPVAPIAGYTEPLAQRHDQQAVTTAPPVISGGATPVKVTMGPSLKIESADGLYSFQPYGRIHYDYTALGDDQLDRANNAQLRRARLGFRGAIGEDLSYRMEMDFGNEDTNLRDAFLTYHGFEVADLTLGNMKPALGLEQLTSSNDIGFVERAAATNAFTRGHVLGAALLSGGNNWSWRSGIYNEDANVNNGTDDEAVSVDARITGDLLYNSPHVLHLGAGGSWRRPNSVGNSLTFAAAPAGTGPLSIVSTGAIAGVDDAVVYGAELASIVGPWSAQAEYLRADVTRDGLSSASFDGWYAQTGWIFTGESRPYEAGNGVMGRVKPRNPFSLKEGGWGAVEALARYDTLDLNDAGAGILGGQVKQYGLGVNWYLRDNLRLMGNYTSVNSDTNAVVPDDDPDVYHLRAQWDF